MHYHIERRIFMQFMQQKLYQGSLGNLIGRGRPAPNQYPWLDANEHCEVLVLGGGITGCLAAYQLSQSGIDVVLVTSKPLGYGEEQPDSSALCSQTELFLSSLSAKVGRDAAVTTFSSCINALDEIEAMASELSDFGFVRRDAFVYTNDVSQKNNLHAEYLIRRHNGFSVEFLEQQDARELFSFPVQAGLLVKEGGAMLDSYLFCHALAKGVVESGGRVYENTTAVEMLPLANGVTVTTGNGGGNLSGMSDMGRTISAGKLVLAIGDSQDEFLHCLCGKRRIFSLLTPTCESFAGYESRALVRDIERDVRMRVTSEDRILLSGLSCSSLDRRSPLSGILLNESFLSRKYSELESRLAERLCGMPELRGELFGHGSYGVTKDGLPIIGTHPSFPNAYFDLPASLNGIIYGMIGAKMITQLYLGENPKNPFSPGRFATSRSNY